MFGRLARALSAVAAVLFLGTLGYMLIERWPLLDALYMTVITVSTVGFKEVRELSTPGLLFTMALIFGGFGAMLFFVGTLIDFIVEGHLRRFLEGRRMDRRIQSLDGHRIVVGLGRVGYAVARSLAEAKAAFVVIDSDPEALEVAKTHDWLVVEGDATSEEVLRHAGVERAQGLVTAVDTDADNIFVTLTARTMNPDIFIVARSSLEASEERLRRAGANRVLTPNELGGRRLAALVLNPLVADFLDLVTHGDDVEFRLQEYRIGEGAQIAGQTIGEAHVRRETGVYILAVQSPDGTINTNPASTTRLELGDRLIVLGTSDQLHELMRLV